MPTRTAFFDVESNPVIVVPPHSLRVLHLIGVAVTWHGDGTWTVRINVLFFVFVFGWVDRK